MPPGSVQGNLKTATPKDRGAGKNNSGFQNMIRLWRLGGFCSSDHEFQRMFIAAENMNPDRATQMVPVFLSRSECPPTDFDIVLIDRDIGDPTGMKVCFAGSLDGVIKNIDVARPGGSV